VRGAQCKAVRAQTAPYNEETRMFEGLDAQRLVALFFAGGLLLNFPLLALWDHNVLVLGLPLFPLALFGLWALLIALLAWVVEGHTPALSPELHDRPD
jgi:hypothetical protein